MKKIICTFDKSQKKEIKDWCSSIDPDVSYSFYIGKVQIGYILHTQNWCLSYGNNDQNICSCSIDPRFSIHSNSFERGWCEHRDTYEEAESLIFDLIPLECRPFIEIKKKVLRDI